MKFTKLFENGPVLLEVEQSRDDRGFFARSFCIQEFERAGLPGSWPQSNISFNYKKGTVRGMHYQVPPHPEPKIVRCTAGAICDAVIDLRKTSPHFCKTFMVELSADKHNALYVPAGFAHGFQTLKDNTEVLYLMGSFFHPESQRGIKWNDC
ncbi:MAG: dTDP-4-dehydrorhamnose 3,5-epimerase family protein, partial [Bdellovibrionota bacterium]